MLSRRNLRIKVMQAIYALDQGAVASASVSRHNLSKHIRKAYDLVLFDLSLIVRIANYLEKEAALKAAKLLPTEEDLNFNTRLTRNPVIAELKNQKEISNLLKLQQTDEEEILVKTLFNKLLSKNEYHQYCNSNSDDIAEEKKILTFIYNKIIVKNSSYHQYLEEAYPECQNDLIKINFKINDILESYTPGKLNDLLQFTSFSNEESFALQLHDKILENADELTKLIQPKLQNWDLDRIALIDMILMKMALCELLYFDEIPVKVSINEYIDISKIYSTPKSKDFINGVLDKVMNDLKAQGRIKKAGRGLME